MLKLVNAGRWFVSALAVLGVISYGAAAAVTLTDVLGRRVGYPIEGVVDLVQLFVMAGAWFVMPYAFMAATHVCVDFLLGALPRSVRVPLRIATAALSLVLIGLLLWQGFETFQIRTMFGDRSQQLGIPVAWYWYPLLIGLAVSLLGIFLELVRSLGKAI